MLTCPRLGEGEGSTVFQYPCVELVTEEWVRNTIVASCYAIPCHSMPLDAARRHSTPVTTACHSTPPRATRCHFNWHGVAWSGTRGQVAWSGMEWHVQNDPGLHVPCNSGHQQKPKKWKTLLGHV